MYWITNDTKEIVIDDIALRFSGKSHDELYDKEVKYRKNLVTGEPKAGEKYSVQQLKDMGMIGLYHK